mmetsp:Transcript_27166/g.44294  ORF Transcript_27166/g.44294 Transcript_27166/m.44294 type:complete len:808 (-) Transcript_27166:149-2572(-)|eukprot:CAMPEP_0184675768 /NCGR_PEP_ID=MMETSP0308-20130426/87973_1 /TAXON_ID=38269 /ORGANISM="Gloeochaete witrockiana, Strain SAG 46.84" /LENGTH=807 /DNA_ID=CAMNT_0027123515 /DNA_START=76 /DNA_END=2499 /DNA_ORIENTATION=-
MDRVQGSPKRGGFSALATKKYKQASVDGSLSANTKPPASKYDFVKVRVHLEEGHYYVFSRFLLSRVLTVTMIKSQDAIKIALTTKKQLVDNGLLDLPQSAFEKQLFTVMQMYNYGAEYITRFQMMTRFFHQRVPLIIFLTGTGCVGKSTLAMLLAERLNLPNVVHTDMVSELISSIVPATRDVPLWYRLHESEDTFLHQYKEEAKLIRQGIEPDLRKSMKEGKAIIIEGVHLDLSLYSSLFETPRPGPSGRSHSSPLSPSVNIHNDLKIDITAPLKTQPINRTAEEDSLKVTGQPVTNNTNNNNPSHATQPVTKAPSLPPPPDPTSLKQTPKRTFPMLSIPSSFKHVNDSLSGGIPIPLSPVDQSSSSFSSSLRRHSCSEARDAVSDPKIETTASSDSLPSPARTNRPFDVFKEALSSLNHKFHSHTRRLSDAASLPLNPLNPVTINDSTTSSSPFREHRSHSDTTSTALNGLAVHLNGVLKEHVLVDPQKTSKPYNNSNITDSSSPKSINSLQPLWHTANGSFQTNNTCSDKGKEGTSDQSQSNSQQLRNVAKWPPPPVPLKQKEKSKKASSPDLAVSLKTSSVEHQQHPESGAASPSAPECNKHSTTLDHPSMTFPVTINTPSPSSDVVSVPKNINNNKNTGTIPITTLNNLTLSAPPPSSDGVTTAVPTPLSSNVTSSSSAAPTSTSIPTLNVKPVKAPQLSGIILPFILTLDETDHAIFIESWLAHRSYEHHLLQRLGPDIQTQSNKLLQYFATLQNYLCASVSPSITVVKINPHDLGATVDYMHRRVLQSIEDAYRDASCTS